MIPYACPKCGKAPTVTVCGTPSGNLWIADCGCMAVHGSDEFGLGFSWACYCMEMLEAMDP